MWVDIGLVVIVVAAYFLTRKWYQDIFTPLFFYVLVWCTCLFLFRLRLVNYDELGTGTIAVIAGSMAAFVVGCLAAGKSKATEPSQLKINLLPLEKGIRVLIAVNTIGIFLFALRMAATFGISTYFADPTVIRLNYEDLGRIGAMALLLLVNYPLCVCSLVHVFESKKLRWFTALGLALPFIQGYITMSRNTMAVPIATALFVWIYYRGWRSFKRELLTRGGLVLGVIVLYFVGVGAWYGKLASSESSSFSQSDFNVSSQIVLQLVDPYIYATCAFPTLQAATHDVHGHLWGTRTFFPIARLMYAVGLLSSRPENASLDFYFVPIPSNVSTYLFTLYEDFGTLGMIIFPFLLGWIATRFYLRMRVRPTIFSLTGTAAFMVVTLYSVFISLSSTFLVWYYLFLMFWVSRNCAVAEGIVSAWPRRLQSTCRPA